MSGEKRIFFSHSSKDNKMARTIVEALKSFGFDVWYDEQSLEFGPIRQRFEEILPTCQVFMVLLSEDAIKSVWVNREIDAALALERNGTGIVIVPVLVQPCDIPLLLERYRWLNCIPDRDVYVELGQLARLAGKTGNEKAEHPVPPATEPKSQTRSDSPQSTQSEDSKSGDQSYKVKFKIGKTIATNSNQYIADTMTINVPPPPASTKEEESDAQ